MSKTSRSKQHSACDILVIGGGPAGLAIGIALAYLGRSVVVLEQSRYDRPHVGETFGPELKPHLHALGAWDDFAALQPVPFRGVQSAWGSPSLSERSSIFHPLGEGWHVDRSEFEQMLVAVAEGAGVVVRQDSAVRSLERRESRWQAGTMDGFETTARYLVDASGRGAPATAGRVPERRWLRLDRQVAVVSKMIDPARPIEPLLLLEAVADGWWYSVPQPNGILLVVFVTDADLLPAHRAPELTDQFLKRLAETVQTSARAQGAGLASPPWIARSESGILLPDRGTGWQAVGDAAIACDPLAGDGVVRAFAASLQAAPEIHRALDCLGSEGRQLPRTHELLLNYLDLRARYYQVEGRWPEAPFWARRRPVDWKTAPLFLEPQFRLSWRESAPTAQVIAPVEALIPPGVLTEVRETLVVPMRAHEVMTRLRALFPVGDRQLLVGLQMLVTSGCVASEEVAR